MSEDGEISYFHIHNILEKIAMNYAASPEITKGVIADLFLTLQVSGLCEYLRDDEIESCSAMLSSYGSELVDVCKVAFLSSKLPIGAYKQPLWGSGENETLVGSNINDILVGLGGNDALVGGSGDDILIGGTGDDVLRGGSGSDTYIWELGDGNDSIVDMTAAGDVDVLRLGEGVHAENAAITREGNTIYLTIGESGERIAISSSDRNANYLLTRVEFADGTKWTREYMLSMLQTFSGTDDGDRVTASTGNDILIGGKGDDYLSGLQGSDTYIWNPGDGNDTILEERFSGDVNILKIGAGVDPASVVLLREGNNLVLHITETGERITLEKWFGQYVEKACRISSVEFADGTVWTADEIHVMGNENITGTDGDDVIDGLAGDDVLTGGKGNDLLRGGMGSDVYIWNIGDGNDVISDKIYNNDVNILRFGEGVSPDGIGIRKNGNDLLLTIGETGETITVSGWGDGSGYKLGRIEFADGTAWTAKDIDGTVGNNFVGTDADDTLRGSAAADVLTGGKGDDTIYGNGGDDVYVWKLGDGNDTIVNSASYGKTVGRLRIGGVDSGDVRVTREKDNLVLTIGEGGERIVLSGWFKNYIYKLSRVEFSDGTIWDTAQIEALRDIHVRGTDADETLTGFASDDILIGGKGGDVLYGGGGSDIYVWNLGDGNDVIRDIRNEGETSVLRFGEGVSADGLMFKRRGDNLLITVVETGETITVDSWYLPGYSLSRVEFADGGSLSAEEVEALVNREIIGSDGNDTIRGDKGSDILIGGKGDDYMDGGAGSDFYVWNIGDGNDTICDRRTNGETSVLIFGDGVSPDGITISARGNDLLIVIGETGETLAVTGWFVNEANRLTGIVFADGTQWSVEDIENRFDQRIIGTGYSETLYGNDGDNILIGGGGNDSLLGGSGNDTYIWNFGDGNDRIIDNSGDNTLRFGTGVEPQDVSFDRSGNDLVVRVTDAEGKASLITVDSWYYENAHRLARIEFADGTVRTTEEIERTRNRIITGTASGETLTGFGGEDNVLIGGKGNDTLRGGTGSDTYIWNPGDGSDTIRDASAAGDANILALGEGVSQDNVRLSRSDDDLLLVMSMTGETITVAGWFDDPTNRLARFEFADGTVWTTGEIEGFITNNFIGTDAGETLSGSDNADILIGGKGDDYLYGGYGSDRYIWNLGDGNDRIIDTRSRKSESSVLQFGEGVEPDKVTIGAYQSDLLIRVTATGEVITVESWFGRELNKLTQIEFADGTVWNTEQVEAKLDNHRIGTDGDDTLYGDGRDELIIGGKGNDTLNGGDGFDTYLWNLGDGNDTIRDWSPSGWTPEGEEIVNTENKIKFGEGVDASRMTVRRNENALYLKVGETGEFITIKDWFSSKNRRLAYVEFADGTLWSADEIDARIGGYIVGTDESDYLYGGSGTGNIFVGGKGDDIIMSRYYSWIGHHNKDTYVWNLGDGNDVITDEEGENTIALGEGISPSSISTVLEDFDLLLVFDDTGETIRISEWYRKRHVSKFLISFSDGTSWSSADIMQSLSSLAATRGDDILIGTDADNVIEGSGGNDTLLGAGGNDTYVWNIGDGNDTIVDYDGTITLRLGDGVKPGDVYLGVTNGNDLFLYFDSGETITLLSDYYTELDFWHEEDEELRRISEPVESVGRSVKTRAMAPPRMIFPEWVEFADGTVWTREDVEALLETTRMGTDADEDLNSRYMPEDAVITLIGREGDDYLHGGDGDERYVWFRGDGNDTIKDDGGNGTLKFAAGVDPAKIRVTWESKRVVLHIGETGERVTLLSRLTDFRFADGTVWSWDDLVSLFPPYTSGTNASETISGTLADDVFDGRGGDDVLIDYHGNDTYIWNRGDGNDTTRLRRIIL